MRFAGGRIDHAGLLDRAVGECLERGRIDIGAEDKNQSHTLGDARLQRIQRGTRWRKPILIERRLGVGEVVGDRS